jgi:hypothetical protein
VGAEETKNTKDHEATCNKSSAYSCTKKTKKRKGMPRYRPVFFSEDIYALSARCIF